MGFASISRRSFVAVALLLAASLPVLQNLLSDHHSQEHRLSFHHKPQRVADPAPLSRWQTSADVQIPSRHANLHHAANNLDKTRTPSPTKGLAAEHHVLGERVHAAQQLEPTHADRTDHADGDQFMLPLGGATPPLPPSVFVTPDEELTTPEKKPARQDCEQLLTFIKKKQEAAVRLRPLEQYSSGPLGVNGTWAYKNGVQDDVSYSHMAMVEQLPPGAKSTYLSVWQAADRVAGGTDMHIRATVSDDLVHWEPTWKIPLPQRGALWAPVLFLAGKEVMLLYTESFSCIRERPKLGDQAFAPGGDIKMVRSTNGRDWSEPRLVWGQAEEGGVPKVIANRPILLDNGDILLPFWREDPSPISGRCALSAQCKECKVAKDAPVDLSGTLLSKTSGGSWFQGGDIKHPKGVSLLEGTVTQLASGHVLQLFRSNAGNVFQSLSKDRGRSWSDAKPIQSLLNPGSKIAVQALASGFLALGFNDHGKLIDGQKVSTRTRLRVALSTDGGLSWFLAALLEENIVPLTKFHYPTLIVPKKSSGKGGGCQLGVMYTIGYKERASEGGVRSVIIDLNSLRYE